MKSLLGTFSQWRHLPGIYWGISTSRSATGGARRYILICFNIILTVEKHNSTANFILLTVFAVGCTSHIFFCLVVSLIENGGVIGQDKEGEAYFYSLLYFGM